MSDDVTQEIDALAEAVEDVAERLGLSPEEVADRVLNEIKARL